MPTNSSNQSATIRPGLIFLAGAWFLLSVVLACWQAPHPQPNKPVAEKNWWEWLRYPIEKNAAARLPAIPNELLGLYFSDDQRHGWAVGVGGTILSTDNGGKTWYAQNSGVQTDLWSVRFNGDSLNGWAFGDGGTILSTKDGGHSWVPQNSGTQNHLRAVNFAADGRRGWAVGFSGTILATDDGGQTWGIRTTPTQEQLWALDFAADGQHGLAVGTGGAILATDNGGKHWTAQISGTDEGFSSLYMTDDALHGWVVGTGGIIVSTEDGGHTWKKQISGTESTLNAVSFTDDARHGWVVGDDGTILATDDGGQTWSAQISGTRTRLWSVQSANDRRHGWAVGGGTILLTDDLGKTWVVQSSGSQSTVNSVCFSENGFRGWAVAGGGLILTTINGGKTWAPQSSGTQADLFAVHFAKDGHRGWVVGSGGTILATEDGGQAWKKQTSGTQVNLNSVAFAADALNGWVTGDNGWFLVTNDGGQTWEDRSNEVSAHDSNELSAHYSFVYAADGGLNAWVVGSSGTILATRDGGQTWAKQISGTQQPLFSTHFAEDAQHGWAVGGGGTILTTDNGGERWKRLRVNLKNTLWAVKVSKSGKNIWLSGSSGLLMHSDDSGASWQQVESQVGTTRSGLAVSRDASRIWAVGYPPALLKSVDAGITWQPQAWPLAYQRYPAPWFWLSLLLDASLLWFGLRSSTGGRWGAAAMGATDAPSGDFARDRLRFAPLARGISRFLRNPKTEPPLTLAISGDWGSGKSTLMQLICTDMRHYGSRPVWFNAWHHQQEANLLASLLTEIRDHGLPPISSPDGWLFRFSLLWLRIQKHPIKAFLILTFLAATVDYLYHHDLREYAELWNYLQQQYFAKDISAVKPQSGLSLTDKGRLLTQFTAFFPTVIGLFRAYRAFKTNPAVLQTAQAGTQKLRDADAQTRFRSQFAEEFDEVTQALPYRMVVVIDDLDRCQPETVLEVMEAVNFLMSSGRFFVMFGMATHRVQAALALSFEKIAKEVVELELPANATEIEIEQGERSQRLAYAHDYLEKLINLEINVPTVEDIEPHELLELGDSQTEPSRPMTDFVKRFCQLWPAYLIVAACVTGWQVDWENAFHDLLHPEQLVKPIVKEDLTVKKELKPSSTPTETNKAGKKPVVKGPEINVVSAPKTYLPVMQPGDDKPIAWQYLAGPALMFLLFGIALIVFRLRGLRREVNDSEAFAKAMKVWLPVVSQKRNTPRAVKRFGNRIRYLAMLQQGEQLDESLRDDVLNRFNSMFSGFAKKTDAGKQAVTASGKAIAEHRVVALGALYETMGSMWREALVKSLEPDGWAVLLKDLEAAGRLKLPKPFGGYHALIDTAQKKYSAELNVSWPPSEEELDVFERILKGIRLAGDVAELSSNRESDKGSKTIKA